MRCPQCGEEHDVGEMELGFGAPDAYFKVPEAEREARVDLTSETCSIDGERFFIRGVLEIPVRGREEGFGLGLWAQTSRDNFDRYVRLSSDEEQGEEPPFVGAIANDIAGQPSLLGLPVTVQMESAVQRPSLWVADPTHPLAADQRTGIEESRALELLAPYLH
jgi:hypothetical protein